MPSGSGADGTRGSHASGGSKVLVSSSGGVLHDQLWTKAALDYFRLRHAEHEADGRYPLYSLGPQLGRSLDAYTLSLSGHLDPNSDGADATVVFNFDDDDAASQPDLFGDADDCDETGEVEALTVHPIAASMLFFSVSERRPGRIQFPKRAAKVDGQAFLAISCHPVRELDVGQKKYRVQLEGQGGQALPSEILSACMLSTSDFATMRVWTIDETLQHDFGFAVAKNLEPTMQEVINHLVQAQGQEDPGKRSFFYYDSADKDFSVHTCLQALETRALVKRSGEDSGFSAWTLTAKGRCSLNIGYGLLDHEPALAIRHDVELADRSSYELAVILRDSGWVCIVKPTGRVIKKQQPQRGQQMASLFHRIMSWASQSGGGCCRHKLASEFPTCER